MKFLLMILVTATGIVAAQQSEDRSPASEPQAEQDVYDAEAWLRVSFEDRERLFSREVRDSDWAPAMKQAIAQKVAEFDRPLEEVFGAAACRGLPMCQEEMPPVELESVECRRTLCRIEMEWPPDTSRAVIGQQVSFLYGLGVDHQGETKSRDDGDRYSMELIARRRPE